MDHRLRAIIDVLDTIDTPEERQEWVSELPKDLKRKLVMYYANLPAPEKPEVPVTINSFSKQTASGLRYVCPCPGCA